jgi:hypothetical protein
MARTCVDPRGRIARARSKIAEGVEGWPAWFIA